MSVVSYLWGVVILAGSVWLVGLAAHAVARRALPEWRGPLGVLARACLGLCWVYAVGYVLGAAGQFRAIPLFAVIDGGACAIWLLARRRAPVNEVPPLPAPAPHGARNRRLSAIGWAAGLGAVVVFVAWLPGVAHAYRYGILEPDSLWYHGNLSARFIQTGWLTRLFPVGVDALVPYHPANRELLDAVLDLPWHRDFLLPMTNLLYLGLFLLAAWCVGARWHRGPVALLAAAVIPATPVMRLTQPGSLKNDLLGFALLLAAMALVVHSERRMTAVALAGATLGLAAGTRSNLLPMVAVLAVVGAVLLGRRERFAGDTGSVAAPDPTRGWPRWAPPLAWATTTAGFGAYWYMRNWVRAGNPFPWLDVSLGPIHLSQVQPHDGTGGYTRQTLLEHIDHPKLLDAVIRPGLGYAFGDMWWVLAALAAVSLCLAVASRRPWLVAMAATGALGMLAHLVTPLSLVVPPDNPGAAFNFAFNARYALAAVGLLLVAGACSTRTRALELAFAAAALFVIVSCQLPTDLSIGISQDGDASDAALVLALAAVALALAGGWVGVVPRLRRSSRRVGVAALPIAVLAAALLTVPLVDRHLERRYATPVPKLASALWPTTSRLRDARIGIATDPKPYPDAGADLSNDVSYVGVKLSGGVLRNVHDCTEWGRVVRSLDLTHVALAPEPFSVALPLPILEAWTLAIPGTEVVRREGSEVLISVPPEPGPTPAGRCAPP
jgi:hypothetical protein